MPKKTPDDHEWTLFAKELGLRLQRLRTSRHMSQMRVAEAAGMSRYTYQKFEKGESKPGTPANPTLHNIMALAEVFEVSLDELAPMPWPNLRHPVE
ncbi:helix-turn-helix domain-containing protein [Bifidobacterium cuniculi]|uniref:XRE family transcriptional regulator n=1 Tax=Bifidobacterium cuniculi TaxID=1688 RepID=A0A087AYM9_9BIFI|nr:helix-turn-helix transcriptional regulator [Bifidobacterium cuniculi]KFI63879.1 XRE family transcriptional regulator [Bifidobacterium cuniculi]